jgi:hypothetical protein
MKKYKILNTIGWLFITLQFVKYFSFDLNIIRTTMKSSQFEGLFSNVLLFNVRLLVGIILITISNKKIKELQSEIQ